MKSTIFVNNLTQIDFAFVNTRGLIEGGSFNLNAEITGSIEEVENVVVDFGTVKRIIKQSIDDKETGFDHKLWVLPSNSKEYGFDHKFWVIPGTDNDNLDTTIVYCPKNAIKTCRYDYISNLCKDMELHIKVNLSKTLNDEDGIRDIDVKVFLDSRPLLPYYTPEHSAYFFKYVHGLKSSTSWGCQNIAHGHRSWLMFLDRFNSVINVTSSLFEEMNATLSNAVFVWDQNIIADEKDHLLLGYDTQRGSFRMRLPKSKTNIQITETETTVEHLAYWFVKTFRPEVEKMVRYGAKTLWFSEGLVKGAKIVLEEVL